jgi:uncharacterized membrane protein
VNSRDTFDSTLDVIEYVSVGIEILAVAIIVVGISWATYAFLARRETRFAANRDEVYRKRLGRTLLLGLEVLVAADVIRTVALEPSFESVGILGTLVVIRTFLSWSLIVETEHRWPWQGGQMSAHEGSDATDA